MAALTERFNCQLVIKIDADCTDQTIDHVLSSLTEYQGPAPVLLAARDNGSEYYIRSRKYKVKLDFQLLDSLKDLLGESKAYLRPIEEKQTSIPTA
jgi:hypothetical protein